MHGVVRLVGEFGDANNLPEQQIYMNNLAVEELVTNTVGYDLKGVTKPKIEVIVQVKQHRPGADHWGHRPTLRSDTGHKPRPLFAN